MYIQTLEKDIPVICKAVPEFPMGIKSAFDELYEKFEGREYFGLSHMDEQHKVVYKAAAAELAPGEALQHGYQADSIPRGEYLTEKVTDWMSKTEGLKDVFNRLMSDPRFDDGTECVEWYLSDDEMLCMVKCK